MGRYLNWSDIEFKYPNASRVSSGTNVDSNAHLEASEREVESMLAGSFTVPFSSNNLTAKDLMIDLTYANVSLLKKEDSKLLRDRVYERIQMLCDGKSPMVTNSGESLFSDGRAIWSETQDYQPVFDKGNVLDQGVDLDQAEDLEDAKDWNF